MKAVKVWAPATIANFGPGFDVFGTSLNALGDVVELRESDELRVEVTGATVPLQPEKNVASVAAMSLAKMWGEEFSFHMRIEKGIRPGSGLGSSGASSLAGALAMARFLGVEDDELILKAALEGEKIASGSAHGDNVVPAYYGGFVIVNSLEPLDIVKMGVSLKLVVILPEVSISTEKARKLLPEKIPLRHAVKNISLASSLILSLLEGDTQDAARYLEDYLAFPYRQILYPWFHRIRKAAMDAGAYNIFISGSGPALFALGEDLREIGEAVKEEFESMGIESEYYVTRTGGRAKCI